MKKLIGFIPAILFSVYCLYVFLVEGATGFGLTLTTAVAWLSCFFLASVLLYKGSVWGGVFGVFPALHMMYRGGIEAPIGIALVLFYLVLGIYLWKKRDVDASAAASKEDLLESGIKVGLTILVCIISPGAALFGFLTLYAEGVNQELLLIGTLLVPALLIALIWLKKQKKYMVVWGIVAALYFIALGVNFGYVKYDQSITVNTSPNINVHEYLPFQEDSKIVRTRSQTLQLTDNLPRIDGAAAVFPVYSAFVNAVYPETTELGDGVFEYNNTTEGYEQLAQKKEDIFIGAYPSEQQRAYAEECNTTWVYTPIGTEAFIFFVHKDNPLDNLTTEQIQGIYSGEITNWKQVGGNDEEIAAFQRNQGSGSQSMLERFMGDKPIMEASTEMVNSYMSGIVEQVSSYRSKPNSIGFSFRYYVEEIIRNPDIKMLSVDGVAPTADNIRNKSYPLVTPIYAVTYEENPNKNVDKFVAWMLSEEGQSILEKTGYVGIA